MPGSLRTWIVLACLAALPASAVGAAAAAAAPRATPRIVGGGQVSLTAHPWQVAVFFWNGDEYVPGCGGAILDTTHVLTAAHCLLDEFGDPIADPTDVAVLAGVDDLAAEPLPDEQFVEAASLEAMGTYGTPREDAHDAGIITLSRPLTRNPRVQPAALTPGGAQAPAIPSGTPLTVSGWGSIDPDGTVYDSVLNAVAIKAVGDDDCATDFPGDLDPPTMLCAIDAGRDSCFGDSGGPLTMTDGLLVGLVSFGPDSCGGALGPGVYTELAEATINAFARFSGYGPPQSTAAPSVTGTPQVGTALSCDPGTWSAGAAELAFRFERGGAARAVARDWQDGAAQYTPTPADAGGTLRCLVRARADGGAAIAASAPTAAVAGPGGSTYALTLTPTSATPATGETVTITAAGAAATASDLWWYFEEDGESCAATRDAQAARAGASTLGARYGLTGPFARTVEFQGPRPVGYRICAYLYDQGDPTSGAPRAAAATTITPVAPPSAPPAAPAAGPPAAAVPPPPAGRAAATPLAARVSAPARQRLGRGTIRVRVSCDRPCRLAASGRIGRLRTTSARLGRETRAATLTLRLSKASRAKVRRMLRTRRRVTVTVTVVASAGGTSQTLRRTIRLTR